MGLRPIRRYALAPAAIAALIALPVGTLKAQTDNGRVVDEAETEYQYARVIERDDGSRRLELNEGQAQHIGSAVAVGDRLYQAPAERSRVECVDPRTGRIVWENPAGGVYWGSMVLAAGRLYVTSQKGATIVFKPNPEKFEHVATNELNETCNATPAVSDGDLFIRTHKALYRIAE